MKQILYELAKINEELLRRYNNNALERYNTGEVKHIKQLEFHKCTKRNRWVFGGNRSGKTECGAVESVWLARGNHPFKKNKKNVRGWVVSLTKQVQRDVAQDKILHYLNPDWIEDIVMCSGRKDSPDSGIIDYITIKNTFGGISKIGFKSCDQGREKFQGTSLDFVWFDEEPPKDIYDECRMRVIDRCGEVFGTMTPLKGLTWIYNDIYLNNNNDTEVWYIFMEWADNPYLNQSEIKLLTASLSESELESRRYGKFVGNGGMVYNEFDENIHVIEPFDVPYDWYDTISIDPGLNNPLSCHFYAVDFDGNVYVIREHYEAKRDIAYHANKIKEICNELKWHRRTNGMIEALIDSAASQRTLASEKSVVELFYDHGILVNTKVDKNLFAGLQRVKSYLRNADGETKLYIFKNCVNMIREFKGYYWGNGDAPIKRDDHALDELRYYIMNKPNEPKVQYKQTQVQKDKEKLIRRLKNRR